MQFKSIPIIKAEDLIPRGMYCYTPVEDPNKANGWVFKIKCCPFWSRDEDAYRQHGEQASGYCSYLKKGDWMDDGTMLLWDQVKECGLKDDDFYEELQLQAVTELGIKTLQELGGFSESEIQQIVTMAINRNLSSVTYIDIKTQGQVLKAMFAKLGLSLSSSISNFGKAAQDLALEP